jgi:CheY-like chemotaxis protein
MPIANSESILIVDDEQLVAETLKEGLERQGHRCLIAGTGAEAQDGGSIRAAAAAAGMRTMFGDGLAKVFLGETTLTEVFRVAM